MKNAIEMFGCDVEVLDEAYADILGPKEMAVMGMLSDAQHEMSVNMNETARHTLNRAKYFLSKMIEERLRG